MVVALVNYIFNYSFNGNVLEGREMQTIMNICDESSAYLQECLTVNKITQINSIKLVSFYLSIVQQIISKYFLQQNY